MRILGLDLGTKTLGLAITDKTNLIATPYKTLFYQDYAELISELQKIIVEKDIGKLVLGYPKNMNNTLGEAIERTAKFKQILEQNFTLPIYLIDERLTTKEAEKYLIDTGLRRDKRKKVIDSYAAALILETYLKESRE